MQTINVGNLWNSYISITTATKKIARPFLFNFNATHPYPDSTATAAVSMTDTGQTGITGMLINDVITRGANNSICSTGGIVSNFDASYTGYGSNFSTRPVNLTPNCRNTLIMGLVAHDSMGFLDTNITPNSGFEIHGVRIVLIGARFWNNTGDGLRCQSDGAFIRDVLSYNNGGLMPFDEQDTDAGLKVLGPNFVNPDGCKDADIDGVKTYDLVGNQAWGYKEVLGPTSNPLTGVRLGRGNRFQGTIGNIDILGNTKFDHQGAAGTDRPAYQVGVWDQLGGLGPAGTAVAPGANLAICYPASVNDVATLSDLGTTVTTLDAAGSFQLAIYNNGSWGRPSTLLGATGDLSTAATGNVSGATDPDPKLLSGLIYWRCFNTNSATAIWRSTSTTAAAMNPFARLLGSTSLGNVASGTIVSAVSVAQAYGAWPAWTISTPWGDVTTVIAPFIVGKIGSLP